MNLTVNVPIWISRSLRGDDLRNDSDRQEMFRLVRKLLVMGLSRPSCKRSVLQTFASFDRLGVWTQFAGGAGDWSFAVDTQRV
jgi:hypothetical protein